MARSKPNSSSTRRCWTDLASGCNGQRAAIPLFEAGAVRLLQTAICWGKAARVASADGTKEAIDLMVRGLQRFPESAELHAELALYCCQRALNYDRDGRQDLLAQVEHHLEEASRIAPRASMTLGRHSSVRNMLGQYDKALVAGEQLAKL